MQHSAGMRSSVAPRSVCFIHTSPAMVHLLAGAGPDAMGGAELQMYLLGREMSGRGWDVSCLVGDYGQQMPPRTDGMRVELVNGAGRQQGLFGTPGRLHRFWRSLARVDADFYVTRGLTAQTGVVAAFARSCGKHSLFWFGKNLDAIYAVPTQSELPLPERIPAWYGMRHACAVVCQTERQLDLLARHVGRSGVLIRNVTPWHDMEPADRAGGPVLWVGSIQPKKRPLMFLNVASRLPEVEFVMAGGRMKGCDALYEAVVARTGELPNVRYLGFVPHTEILQHFRSAAMLMSTSEGEQEGFPNVFLQAWSLGLPVAATCDPDGIIKTRGLGCACSSESDLVQAIDSLRDGTRLGDSIAGRARAYVQEYHSARHVGNQLEALLRSIQGARPADATQVCATL